MLSETSDFRDLLTLLVMIRIGLLNERQTLFCRSLSLFLFFCQTQKERKHKTTKFKESLLVQFNKPHIQKIVGFSANFDEKFFFLFLEKKMFGLLFFYF